MKTKTQKILVVTPSKGSNLCAYVRYNVPDSFYSDDADDDTVIVPVNEELANSIFIREHNDAAQSYLEINKIAFEKKCKFILVKEGSR